MVPSLNSHTWKRLKSILDVATNVVVILFAIVAICVLVRNYFAPQNDATQEPQRLVKGTKAPSDFVNLSCAPPRVSWRPLMHGHSCRRVASDYGHGVIRGAVKRITFPLVRCPVFTTDCNHGRINARCSRDCACVEKI